MSIFSKSAQILTNLFRPDKIKRFGNDWFYGIGGANTWNNLEYLDAYSCVPELNAIIGMKANAFSNGQIKEVNDDGEEVPSKAVDLLKQPNWMQSEKEFLKQTKIFHEVFGNEYLYFLYPLGFKVDRSKAIFSIPPHLIKAQYDNQKPYFMFSETPEGVTYKITYGTNVTDLPSDQILHMNDNRIDIKSVTDRNLLLGTSKMEGLKPAINNIKMAYESRGVTLKYRGALGILSNNASGENGVSIPLRQDERDRIQDAYSGYGGLSNQAQVIITSANLKWQQMSINPDKLGLFKETLECFMRFCDSYGTPNELFAGVEGATYENKRQAEKGMYSNTIIPEACEWINGINRKIYPNGNKTKLIMTYHHLAIFQEDLKFRGEALEKMVNSLSKMLADGAIDMKTYQSELTKLGIGTNKN